MPARIHPPTPRRLQRLAGVLRRGGLVAIPTETVYGLAGHALDVRACRRIFAVKRRPADDPLIVHVAGLAAAEKLAVFNAAARVLARHFWPGPLTLVLPRRAVVPDIVTSGQSTVALRAPAHPVARRLLRAAKIPLAAPSANLFGYISPTTADHVAAGLGKRIGHILDGGPCAVGVESTIVDVSDPARLRILRPGALAARELLAVLRRAGVRARFAQRPAARRVLAPGLLDQHYSPHTPLRLVPRVSRAAMADPAVGVILRRKPAGRTASHVFWLSARGDMRESARRLYATLRRADAGGFRAIVVERCRATAGDALAAAINDRLTRAAGKRRR